jgi:hypothetical protein
LTTGVDMQTSMTEIQSRIANGILIAVSIFTVPGLAASLWRIQSIGWQPVMALHVGIAGAIWIITIFRGGISLRIRGITILAIVYILAFGGFLNFALIGAGYPALIVATVSCWGSSPPDRKRKNRKVMWTKFSMEGSIFLI